MKEEKGHRRTSICLKSLRQKENFLRDKRSEGTLHAVQLVIKLDLLSAD